VEAGEVLQQEAWVEVKEKPIADWNLQQKRCFGVGERLRGEGTGGWFWFILFSSW